MRLFGLTVVAFALSGMISGAQAAEPAECSLKRYTSIDFEINDTSQVLIPLTIDGKPAKAVLALTSMLSSTGPNSAARLGLPTQSLITSSFVTIRVNGNPVTQKTRYATLTFGNVKVDADFLITTDPGESADVRLGMGIFNSVDFELDFVNRKLSLYSHDHCPGKVVYWANNYGTAPIRRNLNGDPYLVMELDGRKIQTVLGVGVPITSLSNIAATQLYGIENPTGRDQFMELTSGGLSIMNAHVAFDNFACGALKEDMGPDKAAGFGECFNIFPLKLGMNVLTKLRLYFANKENVLYFTVADATN